MTHFSALFRVSAGGIPGHARCSHGESEFQGGCLKPTITLSSELSTDRDKHQRTMGPKMVDSPLENGHVGVVSSVLLGW
jgi:hypothetical protein